MKNATINFERRTIIACSLLHKRTVLSFGNFFGGIGSELLNYGKISKFPNFQISHDSKKFQSTVCLFSQVCQSITSEGAELSISVLPVGCRTKYYSIPSGSAELSKSALLVGCCTKYYSITREGAVLSITVLIVRVLY